ncbi:MAG: hypothetical protein IPP93_02505 [Chitinophagaceae bacterium]|nr:hypothetical protein [Chitinophagaceae bacterium]
MKNILLGIWMVIAGIAGQSQSIGIGTASPNTSAQLDISSSSKGILIPRMTTTQRNAIASPANGLTVYNTTTKQYNLYNGTRWQIMGALPSGSMVLSKSQNDPTLINEGFKYAGYLTHNMVSQVIGDSVIPALQWYKGNLGSDLNLDAPRCNSFGKSVYTDSGVYFFSQDSIFNYSRNTDKWTSQVIPPAYLQVVGYSPAIVKTVSSWIVFWNTGLQKGARFNYRLKTWDSIAVNNAFTDARTEYSVISSGAELIIYGGRIYDNTSGDYTYMADGYRYSPFANVWEHIPAPAGFQGRVDFAMAYANDGLFIWGGRKYFTVPTTVYSCFTGGPVSSTYDSSVYFTDGRFYNVQSNSWTEVPANGGLAGRQDEAVFFDGSNIVITGGRQARPGIMYCYLCNPPFPALCFGFISKDSVFKSGAKYDPFNNSWAALPDAPRPFSGAYPLWDNDQFMTVFIGDDTTLSLEPSANDWYINLFPALHPNYVSNEYTSFAVSNGDFIIFSPNELNMPANVSCWSSRKAIYNFRPQPVTIQVVKSSEPQTNSLFYLYMKE